VREQDRDPDSDRGICDVREAEERDLSGVLEVQRSAGRADTDAFAQSILQSVKDPDRFLVVAETDGRLVGWASTKYFPGVDENAPAGHYLMGITVAPQSRRLGVARSLIAARLTWIAQFADNAFYFASSVNHASIDAHKPWNFHEIARANQFRGVPFASGDGILFRAELR